MKIEVAEHAGYCYGVERALKLTREAAEDSDKPIYTLGPIIHNPQVVESLAAQNVYAISDLSEIEEGTIIVRSHGVDPRTVREARKKNIKVVDATCPFVKKAQQRAAELVKEGYQLVIAGERDHPEVIGILAHAKDKALIAEKVEDIQSFHLSKKVGVVVQTTQSEDNLKAIVSELLSRAFELKVFNTICNATLKRQLAAQEIAKKADVVLVVGGKNSANTTRLAQMCKQINPKTYHIETASEIDPSWFAKNGLVGVTAGASTPKWILEEVVEKLKSFNQLDCQQE
jgi:4-hydroxy-3-methylbut-2-enyl diphosphate reductase